MFFLLQKVQQKGLIQNIEVFIRKDVLFGMCFSDYRSVLRLHINTRPCFKTSQSHDICLPLFLLVCVKQCEMPAVPPPAERKPSANAVVSPSWTETLTLDTEVVIMTGASR